MWTIGEKTIKELIGYIDKSELALPQFQRPSVWGKSNWVPFLKAVLLGRPTGTLLLMATEGGRALAPRPIETAPALVHDDLKFFLLDGQQRTTTLYCAVRTGFGHAPKLKKPVVDVKAILDRREFLDEDIAIEPAGAVLGFGEMAKSGRIAYPTLLDGSELANWQQVFAMEHFDGDVGKVVELIDEFIPGLTDLKGYRFPVLLIEYDTPLDVVADIFESMNRRGQALNKFDLMVARLYQPIGKGKYFDLREAWTEQLEKSKHLQQLGVKVDDGMLPLQLIAKQVSRLDKNLRGNVKGLNGADVLELSPDQVTGAKGAKISGLDLTTAVAALEAAAKFLVETCGVVAPHLLPQQTMLLPLGDQFLLPKSERLTDAQLKRWFFVVGLSIDYYGGVNSYADRDCGRLRAWAESMSKKDPEWVLSLNRSLVEGLNLKEPFSREGNILGRTIFSLLVESGALDWQSGQLKVKTFDAIDFHHMVPDAKLKSWFSSAEQRRPIAGMTPISASTNRKIGNVYPKEIIKELKKDADPTARSHCIDKALLDAAADDQPSFERFLDDREARLKAFIIESLGL